MMQLICICCHNSFISHFLCHILNTTKLIICVTFEPPHGKTNNLHWRKQRRRSKLISAFVFATRIVQLLFYLNPKFQASSSFLCLYRPVCIGPVRKPHCWFSHEAAHFRPTLKLQFKSLFSTPQYLTRGEFIYCKFGAIRSVYGHHNIICISASF